VKRVYLFGALIVGTAAGAFFLLQGSAGMDVSSIWESVLSFFRQGANKVDSVTTSDPYAKALDMIAAFEGFSAKAYPDADGFSIGYGHFITQADPYDATSTITESEAYALLEQDARGAQNCVGGAITAPMTINQEAAMISLAYNIGCGNFRSSTLVRMFNAGNVDGAAAQFAVWNKSRGQVLQALVDRRASEAGVFTA
jgi:lysozyme